MAPKECEELLQRAHVGRLAYALHDAVDVVPLGFRFDKGWIYGRTSPAGKLETLDRNRRVAFEVDEFKGPFEWSSVVVQGSFYLLDPDSSDSVRQTLQGLFPDAFGNDDPVAFRNQFFGILIEEMTGRSARPVAGEKKPVMPAAAPSRSANAAEDARLRNVVVAEIARIAEGERDKVRTAVESGIVILTGSVSTQPVRSAIDTAIAAVPGVNAIVQQLDVEWPVKIQRTPTEVALDAAQAVKESLGGESHHIVVICENGWIRLEGNVASGDHQRLLSSLEHIPGSRGVIDRLSDKP